MALTQQEIKDIALLARIGIDDAEVSAYQNDLSVVLEYFEDILRRCKNWIRKTLKKLGILPA